MIGGRLHKDAAELRALEDKIAALTEQLTDLDHDSRPYRTIFEKRAELMGYRRSIITRQTAAACSR